MLGLFGFKFGSTLKELKHKSIFLSQNPPGPIWQGLIWGLSDNGRMCLSPSLSFASFWVGSFKQYIPLCGCPLQHQTHSLPAKSFGEIRTHLPLYFQQRSQDCVFLAWLGSPDNLQTNHGSQNYRSLWLARPGLCVQAWSQGWVDRLD